MEEKFLHRPVLLEEVLHFLRPSPGDKIIDATIGGAGHAVAIIERISPDGILIGVDTDFESLRLAHERLKVFDTHFELVNKNFKFLKEIVETFKIGEVDGILFDLGVSSIQLETGERGFSIKGHGPLDMRMDRNQPLTARDIVNKYSEEELAYIIKNFGEERFYKRIARAIVEARRKKEIQTTSELVEIVCNGLPRGIRWKRIHPATKVFQALRIQVNDELDSLREALTQVPDILKKGGRVCVISFHSLEDRIVKNIFRDYKEKGIFELLTKKPVVPQDIEIEKNPRARSAKLRAAIKII